ncbi:MAG: GNAT family N-acetyltransferase [Clostridiales bacterium]|jgi:RimJ/RimL family protein N-acetyltransferase|nr:GNAT family N-acetyltransferase [Clostridiales bacterium]
MRYFPKIAGERFYLSPVSANDEDAEKYIGWMNDKTVAAMFAQYNRVVASADDLEWLYKPPGDMQRYAVVLREGDVLIGSISIHNIDHLNRNAFIGIFIGEEEYRGKGYGTEAVRLILNYGFKTLNLHHIMLTVHADNYGGIACYKKAGFREVGRLSEWVFKDGVYVDKLYMGILAREFEEMETAY